MSTTQAFNAPEINASDYYERLGAPPSADAGEIDNHTKKYVAEFKPELSTHENADERWKRFNDARQTLNSPDTKEDYDTFRERFGPENAAEAYTTWQANDALGSPETVSARDLGLKPDVDESDTDQSRQQSGNDRQRSQRRESSRQRRQNRDSREERRRERARRRREGETDIDTDSSKTYSTRTTDGQDDTAESDDGESAETGTFGRVVSHLRTSVDLAATELATMLSLSGLVVAGYLLYATLVEVGAGSVGVQLVQDAATVVVGVAVTAVLAWEYLDRVGRSFTTGAGTRFAGTDAPARLLALPAGATVLWSLVLLGGGGALTVLFLTVSVLSLYGRARGVRDAVDLPEWADYVEPAGGVFAAVVFLALFVQSGTPPASGALLAGADTGILVVVAAALVALVGAPVASVGRRLLG